MVTSALSPFQMYSSESADCGSIQPVPVVPITTRTSRDQASVRSSSLTASCARSSAVGALSTPTYTRIGSSAGSPLNCSRAAASGPRPMKLRPCMPSESQVTSEPGPPERSELVGLVAPCAVVSLVLPYTLSASDDAWVRKRAEGDQQRDGDDDRAEDDRDVARHPAGEQVADGARRPAQQARDHQQDEPDEQRDGERRRGRPGGARLERHQLARLVVPHAAHVEPRHDEHDARRHEGEPGDAAAPLRRPPRRSPCSPPRTRARPGRSRRRWRPRSPDPAAAGFAAAGRASARSRRRRARRRCPRS